MDDHDRWTTLVIAPGEQRNHGRDPQNLATTLCGEVEVTDDTVYRGCFSGTRVDDCSVCAELLTDNHY